MTTVGSYEAKTQLPLLLRKVEKNGESIVITRRGMPIARLIPIPHVPTPEERRRAAKAFIAWRKQNGPTLGKDLTIRQMIEEGRRY